MVATIVEIAHLGCCIAGWDAKYCFDYWRPRTVIRAGRSVSAPKGGRDDSQ